MPRQDEHVRLVGYARVSTDEQVREGISLSAQKERLGAYALAHGAELLRVEVHEGISGKVAPESRPGLARALHAVRQGEADGLLVLKLDRLSRSTRDVLDLVDETRRDGWRLVSVGEHLDTATAAGRLVVTVLAALAEMEREQIGERTRFALDAVAREGRACPHRTPFGWKTATGSDRPKRGDRTSLVEDPEEREILQAMLELEGQGYGARRMAAELNERGIRNPRTGRAWTFGGVASILRTAERRRAAIAS
jgi:DNA invertase Pin-like site-specific DNA recombinase